MVERYEGNYLDALDLPQGMQVPVVIEAIAMPKSERDSRGKVIDAAIFSFKGKQKRLIVGKTSYKVMKAMFGADHRKWVGQTIHIQRRYLEASKGFGVQNCLCIRVVPPTGTPLLKSTVAFMGSATPYGDVPHQQAPKQREPGEDAGPLPAENSP